MPFEKNRFTKIEFIDGEDEEDDYYAKFKFSTSSYVSSSSAPSQKTKTDNSTATKTVRQQTSHGQSALDSAIICALKSHPKTFRFTQKKLTEVSNTIQHLSICQIRELDLYGNYLTELPNEIQLLQSIESCNLGHNKFEQFPFVISSLTKLSKLLLYRNNLKDLSPKACVYLTNLRILNLNYNFITQLPIEIGYLKQLEIFSIEHNQLQELPREIGSCTKLLELYLGYNQLKKLPLEIGYLTELQRLILHRNRLLELPESITNIKHSLKHLDVAANELRIFPSKFHSLNLNEFHYENNPLLVRAPIHSVQEQEILNLKELCARQTMRELRYTSSTVPANETYARQQKLRDEIQQSKRAKEILMQCTECQFCHNYFLNTWLECVEYLDVRKTFKNIHNSTTTANIVPQRVLLCSYECFNSPGHEYFGVAFP
ncbi:unnamed protein product [Didymodactylos carnosus]|uniref:Disease resistance R13L4/SHOC-2-like LRR domain-containing protein n=1 Tax=Didymodactylos carnosus TaxID=1234261 RepID=A0A8S2CMZ9_9BILA|nr:unnamed protein product [Didymodactylos carnosus]CAF3533418.1 unnamed protein product [Didymodactylos carnosus]